MSNSCFGMVRIETCRCKRKITEDQNSVKYENTKKFRRPYSTFPFLFLVSRYAYVLPTTKEETLLLSVDDI